MFHYCTVHQFPKIVRFHCILTLTGYKVNWLFILDKALTV